MERIISAFTDRSSIVAIDSALLEKRGPACPLYFARARSVLSYGGRGVTCTVRA